MGSEDHYIHIIRYCIDITLSFSDIHNIIIYCILYIDANMYIYVLNVHRYARARAHKHVVPYIHNNNVCSLYIYTYKFDFQKKAARERVLTIYI